MPREVALSFLYKVLGESPEGFEKVFCQAPVTLGLASSATVSHGLCRNVDVAAKKFQSFDAVLHGCQCFLSVFGSEASL